MPSLPHSQPMWMPTGMGVLQAGEGILFGAGDVFEEAADVTGQEVA